MVSLALLVVLATTPPVSAPLDSLAAAPSPGLSGLSSGGFTWAIPTVPLGPVVDPDWALEHLSRALWDPVNPTQMGSLDPALQFRVNGEVFRFASERTLRQFMQTPTKWCGVVRDPVTGRRFMPGPRTPQAYWIGGPYFFESDSTKSRFVDDPHRYEIIRRM